MSGDTAWAYDARQRRVTLFNNAARVIRTTALSVLDQKNLVSFTPIAFWPDGRVLGALVTGSSVQFTEADGDKANFWTPTDSAIVVVRADGTVERRIMPMPDNRRLAVAAAPGRYNAAAVPFAGAPMRAMAPRSDRLLYVTHTVTGPGTGRYRIQVMSPRGDTLVAREYSFTSPVVTKQRADSAYEASQKSLTTNTQRDASVITQLLKTIRENIPQAEAPFTDALLGADGTIWLRLPSRTEQSYLIYDERGSALGKVTLPGGRLMVPRVVSRETVWATQRDPDGFIDVIRFSVQLNPPPR
jgi:hypothetical protein